MSLASETANLKSIQLAARHPGVMAKSAVMVLAARSKERCQLSDSKKGLALRIHSVPAEGPRYLDLPESLSTNVPWARLPVGV